MLKTTVIGQTLAHLFGKIDSETVIVREKFAPKSELRRQTLCLIRKEIFSVRR